MPGTSSAKTRFALLPGHDELYTKPRFHRLPFEAASEKRPLGASRRLRPRAGNGFRLRRGAAGMAPAPTSGRIAKFRSLLAIASIAVSVLGVLADVLDRHHVLVLGGVEHDDALGRAAGDPDALDRTADQLPLVGHQHDLVAVLHRERG